MSLYSDLPRSNLAALADRLGRNLTLQPDVIPEVPRLIPLRIEIDPYAIKFERDGLDLNNPRLGRFWCFAFQVCLPLEEDHARCVAAGQMLRRLARMSNHEIMEFVRLTASLSE